MGAPQFTPGPWDADWWASVLRDLHNQPYADHLADEQRDGFNYPGWTLSSDEDARLIAAAPELYEALENLVNHLNERIDDACQNNPESVPVFAGIAAAHDALSLARGAR